MSTRVGPDYDAAMTPAEEKAARLAKALRENLKRRKAQARGEPVRPPAPDADPFKRE